MKDKLHHCFEMCEQAVPSFNAALAAAPQDGLLLEFGVANGTSFTQLCFLAKPRTFYGFDWFYGLPEHWNDDNPKGKFSTNGVTPHMPDNGRIIAGLVQYTLGDFLSEHPEPLAFAHMDLDLYSSTSFVLEKLIPHCHTGTILLFDEIVGNPLHEEQAFLEFLDAGKFDFEFVTKRNRDAIAFRLLQ